MFARLTALLALTLFVPVQAADWKQFRGPDGLGASSDRNLPAKWSAT